MNFTRITISLLFLCLLPGPIALAQSSATPELPRVYLDTTYQTGTGSTINVPAGGDLQAALNAAAPGDTIVLQAGATYTGTFELPVKSGSSYITIRTSTPDSSFPSSGTRVSPSTASLMARVVTPNTSPAVSTRAGSHHYRLLGLELAPANGVTLTYNVVGFGDVGSSQSSLSQVPHDLIVDRCYVHGNATGNIRRGISLNSASTAVVDSYVSDIHDLGTDSQAIAGWNGPGPFKIVNNYLEGAGENVLFGGDDPSVSNLVPSDIEFRRNYCSKPLSWKPGSSSYAGRNWVVKNIFELKNAQRVLADGNTFENNWQAAQNGFSILFTPRNQSGTAPWCVVQDVTFTNNTVRHVASAVNILGQDDAHPSQKTTRIRVYNNLFQDVTASTWGGAGRLLQLIGGPANVTFDHNTSFQTGEIIMADVGACQAFTFTNNIHPNNLYGIIGTGTAPGLSTIASYLPSSALTANAFVGGLLALYPLGNFFPAAMQNVGFVDYNAGNYRLSSSSPYHNAGTDGKDIGADIDAINAASAGSAPAPTPTPSPSPSPSPAPPPPSGAPVISNIAVAPQPWWAVVTWTTNVTSDSRVDVGLSGYEWTVEAYVSPSTSHQVILKGLTAGKTYHYRVRSRDANGNETVSGDATFSTLASTKSGSGGSQVVEPISWQSHTNCSFDRLSIWKTAGSDAADAGAASAQAITQGNGYVEFTVQETNTERWIGLSNGDSGTSKSDIDFAIKLGTTGNASARENGHRMASVDYAPGDTFRVEVRDGVVLYLKNDEVFYTSAQTPVYPLLVDTSFVTVGATFRDLVMSYLTFE